MLSKIDRPNYDYLEMKVSVADVTELKKRVLEKCKRIDMKEMAKEVQPFLFEPADIKKISFFEDYIKQVKLK